MEYSLEPIELNKELILSKVSEEEILSFYGVPIQKGLFCSKLRGDKNPTVSCYRNKKGRLIVHDFGDGSSYDCFGYVQALFQVSYYTALNIIANDFSIVKKIKLTKNKPKIEYNGEKVEEKSTARINVELRDFDEKDLQWWGNYGVTANTLKKFKVFACKTAWLNDNLFYVDTERQKCYGYFGGIKDGIELWRLYRPGLHKFKFVSNWKSNLIQGAHMLPKSGDILIIQKALKDVLCLYEYGIPSIAPCSENEFLSDKQYTMLKQRFKKIIVWYDNDVPGKAALEKIKKRFPEIITFSIPDTTIKDFSDYRKIKGKKASQELLKLVLSLCEGE